MRRNNIVIITVISTSHAAWWLKIVDMERKIVVTHNCIASQTLTSQLPRRTIALKSWSCDKLLWRWIRRLEWKLTIGFKQYIRIHCNGWSTMRKQNPGHSKFTYLYQRLDRPNFSIWDPNGGSEYPPNCITIRNCYVPKDNYYRNQDHPDKHTTEPTINRFLWTGGHDNV